ncbi:MAG: MarR family transcriptional regulator [Chloroflexota bacterium]|nr:MarR family transcriptional regulator [Chloroflexota bacterium]
MADAQRQVHTEQMLQVLQDFMEVLGELGQVMKDLSLSPPDEVRRLGERVIGMEPKYRSTVGGGNPFVFFRTGEVLYRRGNLTMGELSEALSVPFSTATRIASWFVDTGYAERLSDPEDRRVVRLALTDTGRRVNEAVQRHMAENVGKVLGALTVEEQETLVGLFRKVVANLKQTPE